MSAQTTVASIVLAAGSGTRFGHSMNKVWLQLNGKHIISRSLENSRANFSNVRSILVINPDDEQFARDALIKDGALANTEIVHGGATRHESEYKALQYLKRDIEAGLIDLVLIHDGARPLATPELFVAIADGAQTHGGAIPTIALDPRSYCKPMKRRRLLDLLEPIPQRAWKRFSLKSKPWRCLEISLISRLHIRRI
jgi:2-C-methyl-D-erythritol 4-phosphate cytidylyltransferase